MIRLLIDDIEADVLQTEKIVGEYKNAPIGNISLRLGARSIQFKLPKTANNKGIFESSEIASSRSNKPYNRIKSRLFVNGVDMNMLFCILESANESYNIRLYGSNADLFARIKELKLADLDLREYNHHWAIPSLPTTYPTSYPIKYGLIDYNSDSPNTAINQSLDSIYFGTLLPVVYEHFILEKIINEQGFTLVNKTKDEQMFRAYEPVIPIGSDEFKRDLDSNKYIGKFVGISLFPTFGNANLVVQNILQNETLYNTTPSPLIKFQDHVKIRIRGNIRARVTILDPVLNLQTFSIAMQYSSVGAGGYNQEFIFNGLLYDTIFHDYNFDFYLDVEKTIGTFNLISLIAASFVCGSPNNYEVDYANCVFDIYEVEVIEAMPISYLVTLDNPNNNYITIASSLPDFKQSDFVKEYLLKTSSIIDVDYFNKVVYIKPFANIKDNLNRRLDWSGKLDLSKKPTTEFDLDYGKLNTFTYADEDGVMKPNGTDYTLELSGDRVNDTNKILDSKYGATESVLRLNNRTIPQIKKFENYEATLDFTPRCLLLSFENFSFEYRKNLNDALGAVSIASNVPILHFIDSSKDYSYGFERSLVPEFYDYIFGIIDKAKSIKCLIRLNLNDIANMDFLKPIYIKELDATFIVDSVKFEYTSTNSSEVELIKLL